ncbi:unnamed protein product, partial [Prorocentrum cordatum]
MRSPLRRRRGIPDASPTPPVHQRCGAILRPHLGGLQEPEVDTELRAALGEPCAGRLCDFLRRQRPGGQAGAPPSGSERPPPSGGGEGGAAEASEEPPPFVDFDVDGIGDGSKEARKRAHQTVSKLFGSFLNTETVEGEGDTRTIRVWMREAEKRAKAAPGAAADGSGRDGKGAAGAKDGGGKGRGKGKGKGKDKGKKGKGKGKGKKCREEDADEAAGEGAAGAGEFGTLRREGWPKDRPDYLYFRLFKENCDTSEAIAGIARCVGRSTKQFSFAGTKDRRAATVQQVCAHRLPADQLRRSVLHRLWDKRVRISDMEYRAERLRLGRLQGNRFDVCLRGVRAPGADAAGLPAVVDRAFEAVAAGGFLNYFGLQRFGTREVRTHQVGTAIIAGRWQESVRLIVGIPARDDAAAERPAKAARTDAAAAAAAAPPEGGPQDADGGGGGKPVGSTAPSGTGGRPPPRWQAARDARLLFESTGDAQAALEAMPKSQHLERCVLGALARALPPVEALRQLPHQALSLYAHAAQSAVWNAALSRRLRELGPRPVVGDLVLASPGDQPVDADEDPGATAEDAAGAEEPGEGAEEAAEEAAQACLPAVRALASVEELEGVELSDVVLPLPGSEVEYPPCLRAAYEEICQGLLGLPLQAFRDSELVRLTGSYRRAAVRPAGLSWRLVPAAEGKPHGNLLTSDVTRLLGDRPSWEAGGGAAAATAPAHGLPGEATPEEAGGGAAAAAAPAEGPPAEVQPAEAPRAAAAPPGGGPAGDAGADGLPAVTFSCTLPPSAYLTMLLRE